MFMLSQGAGENLAPVNVNITPAFPAPVPVPYVNLEMTATSAPAAYNVTVDAMPALNQLSIGLVSEGGDAGVLGGVVSHIFSGETMYVVGCETILVDGVPAQRLTSVTGQNALGMLPNAPGMCISPSQVTVLALG